MGRAKGGFNSSTVQKCQAMGISLEDYRKRRELANKLKAAGSVAATPSIIEPIAADIEESLTDDEIMTGISQRFDVLELMAKSCCAGDTRALVVSGPPGLSKSYTIEQVVETHDPEGQHSDFVKGFARATGIYKALYSRRERGELVVFDDCDGIWRDEVALNLLKGACDTTEKRWCNWRAETRMIDEETQEPMPRQFLFNGTVIFITNLDLDAAILANHAQSEHMKAMVSRSHYMDLMIKTKRAYMLTIEHVVKDKHMLEKQGYTPAEENEVMAYLKENRDKLRELSLRIVLKIAQVYRAYPKNWEVVARNTCLKAR